MYHKPELEKFGSFRALTQLGSVGAGDGAVWLTNPGDVGCNDFARFECDRS